MMQPILTLLFAVGTAGNTAPTETPVPTPAPAKVAESAAAIPEENQHKPAIDTLKTYNPQPLLDAINNGAKEGEDLAPFFFPADAFDKVKGIKDPGAYHKQLLKWFAADVDRERKRLKAGAPWTLESFKLGGCKWKEKGSEANALPYWSCYKSRAKLKNAQGLAETLEIRVLINWGKDWYITHLGPIPKT